jgi:hypothetical protein
VAPARQSHPSSIEINRDHDVILSRDPDQAYQRESPAPSIELAALDSLRNGRPLLSLPRDFRNAAAQHLATIIDQRSGSRRVGVVLAKILEAAKLDFASKRVKWLHQRRASDAQTL